MASSAGTTAAFLAALLFGVSAPAAKALLANADPVMLAAILYLGAGLGLSVMRALLPAGREETPLRRADLPLMLAVALTGAVIAPVLLLIGLRHVSAVTGSLVLNLEAPLTIAIALVGGEHLGAAGVAGALLVVAGTAVLGLGPGALHGDALGVATIAAACLGWATDNNLTGRLSSRDPLAVAQVKGLVGGGIALVVARVAGSAVPAAGTVAAGLALGLVSYGVSVALAVRAMRTIGVARQSAIFATAPFVGAVVGAAVFGEPFGRREVAVAAVMALGLRFMLRERHAHFHVHDALTHAHRHVHDEHHRHTHGPHDPPGEPHAHEHAHEPLAHAHEHVSDLHHRHH